MAPTGSTNGARTVPSTRGAISASSGGEPRPNFLLRGGLRFSRRDVDLTSGTGDISTDTLGAIGSIRYRPWSFLDLFARYENVQIEDPLVVSGQPTNVPPL